MRAALLALSLLPLAACDTGPTRAQILATLVGHSEADALRTLGAPNQIFQANGSKFLAYYDSVSGYAPTPLYPWGFGYFYYPASLPVTRSCETTLEIAGGKVVSWKLRGVGC